MARVNNEAINTRLMMRHHLNSSNSRRAGLVDRELSADATVMDYSRSEVLNIDSESATLQEILQRSVSDTRRLLLSDTDHQLIFKIVFKETVSLSAIALTANTPPTKETLGAANAAVPAEAHEGDVESELDISAPKVLKCYSNREGFDFYEVEEAEADQVIELTDDNLAGSKVSLRGSRFCRCQTVQLFVEQNKTDSDKSFVNSLKLFGHVVPNN